MGIRRFAVALLLCMSTAALAQAPAPAPSLRFDINEFVIEGNTLFQPYELNALLQPYAGKQRDFGDIQRALEALQDFYTARGYNAVRVLIPEQDIRAGQVRLQVIEARIRNVRIEGNRYYNNANVRASLPALQEGEAPNTKRIGENVQLANENPVRQQRVVLESTEEIGKVDASVKVTDDDPYRVSVFFDNTGNGTTGYYRAGVGVVNANVDNLDHVLNVQLITSPSQWDDVLILGVGYRVPLYHWNALLDAYAGYSDVDSGTVADLFSVSGSGSILGLRYTQILTRYGAYEQKLALGVEQKAFTNDVVVIGGTSTLVPDVTTQPLLITYFGRYAQPGRDFSYTIGFAQNLPSNRGDASQIAIEQARPGASDQFRIWRASAAYTHAIGGDAIVRVAVDGQYTRDVLVPGEQYGIGGVNSVRGFFEREVANDIGHRVSLEAYGPEIGQSIGADWRARMLMFVDMGRGRDNVPVRMGENGLGSVGFGARANRGRNVALRFDCAMVTNQGGTRDKGQARLHFGAAYTF